MLKSSLKSGLSMIEVLIVTAIVGVFVIISITILPQQISKSRDGKRKNDLDKIKVAFENYFSDNDCYPQQTILNSCDSGDLEPYINSIPCDPMTQTKYLYAPEENTSCPHYYRVFANLEIDTDQVVKELKCNGPTGCGAYAFFSEELGENAYEYNYGVSEGVPVYVSE